MAEATSKLARIGRSLQLATLADGVDAPAEYAYELKYDGYRIAAVKSRGAVRLISRRGQDWSGDFATLARRVAALPASAFVLDGEVCAPDEHGVPSFQRLQQRGSRTTSLVYIVFDLLELEGEDLRRCPIEERRRRLERLLGRKPPEGLRLSTAVSGDPAEILKVACRQGFEGIVAKRKGAAYVDGRSRAWLKVKCVRRQEFAIVGYLPYLGTQKAVGSLVLALSEGGELRYAGKVGTGYSDATRKELAAKLDAHPAKGPAARDVPRFGGIARWTQPKLVAEVAFSEWTEAGHVRHPSFQGLRADKTPLECVKEVPVVHAARTEKTSGEPRPAPRARSAKADADKPVVRGIAISHASRVLDPTGVTKLALARYYDAVAGRMLRHVKGRPLTLLRWTPDRSDAKGGIYLRHGKAWGPKELRRVPIQEKTKVGEYLVADTAEALVALAQMDILEIHTWNSTVDDLERPDRVVFDIDPDVSLRWPSVVLAATRIRERLAALRLESFVKTTGGKGLHVVVPLTPSAGWDACLAFTRAFAQSLEREFPKDYVSSVSKAQRRGKVFVDYLRNNRGSTSVSAFSTRARAGGPVSMPIAWEAIAEVDPAAFTVETVLGLLAADDPWKAYARVRQRLPATRP